MAETDKVKDYLSRNNAFLLRTVQELLVELHYEEARKFIEKHSRLLNEFDRADTEFYKLRKHGRPVFESEEQTVDDYLAKLEEARHQRYEANMDLKVHEDFGLRRLFGKYACFFEMDIATLGLLIKAKNIENRKETL